MNERNIMAAIIAAGLVQNKSAGKLSDSLIASRAVDLVDEILPKASIDPSEWINELGDELPDIPEQGIEVKMDGGGRMKWFPTENLLSKRARQESWSGERSCISSYRILPPVPQTSPKTPS